MTKNTLASYLKRINKVLCFIEANLDNELSLEELARIAFFSEYHFHRIFTGMVGESVKSYVRRLRLERAAHQLLAQKLSITQIAFTAGYQTLESFSRAFLQMFKISPKDYRSGKSQVSQKKRLSIEKIGEIDMQVKIKNVPKMKVAYVRHIGPYSECAPAWDKLFQQFYMK